MADSSTQPRAERPSLLLPAALTVALVLLFGFRATGGERIDFFVQSWFWDGHDWLIPKDSGWPHQLLYTGPKVLLYVFALWLFWVIALPGLSPKWITRRRAVYILTSVAVTALLCTQLRDVTHMATPRDLIIYGGKWEHLLLFEGKPVGYPSHAFPAGHASGGCALFCLFFAWSDSRTRRLGLSIACLMGGWMGLYQMARGEHFLSHTLVTAVLAWLVSAALARALRPSDSAA